VDLLSRDALEQWISQAASNDLISAVVYCGSLQDATLEPAAASDRAPIEQEHAAIVLALTQARAACLTAAEAPLYLLSRGLHSVLGERTASPALADAAMWGLARAIAREYPRARCVRIDLDPEASLAANADAIVAEMTNSDGEDEIALRDGRRYVARLQASVPVKAHSGAPEPAMLTIDAPGVLQNLRLQPLSRRAPQRNEIEIEVRATGLGFRDVLNALGMYPGGPVPLGCECAGVVTAVGEDVTRLRVGDEVLAVAYGSFASFVTVPAHWAAKKPSKLSFEQAAAIPSSFLTAHYTLNVLARLECGQRVLIHAGAGGVGQAAIQVAQRAGAVIFATAGSAAKRALLSAMGVQHVLDSRSTEFVEEIRRITQGRGVEVVLNSLAGEFLTGSFAALAEDGCFLEIGKRGILSQEEATKLKPRARYRVVDLGALSPSDPEQVQRMLAEILAGFDAGEYRPLPIEPFPLNRAADAFRHMAQARHVGKIVLNGPSMRDRGAIRGHASYLITGGLGALGLCVAESMVARGAKHVVLVGRNGPGSSAREAITRMEHAGAQVVVAQADVADEVTLAHVLQSLRITMPPLRGVLHAAGVLDDGALDRYEWGRFRGVLAPKVRGAWNLHTLTQQDDLDFFVLFAAAAGLLGLPGQGGYAAANVYLDALAQYRRSRGQTALSIDWGAWSGAGMADNDDAARALSTRGLRFMSREDGVEALWRALRTDLAQLAIMPIDWSRFGERIGAGAEGSLLAEQCASRGGTAARQATVDRANDDFLTRFTASAPKRRHRVLLDFVAAEVRRAVGLPGNHPIDERQPLQELGLDSLMAVELRNALSAGVKRTLPATFAFDYATAEAITRYLLEKLSVGTLPSVESISRGDASPEPAPRSAITAADHAVADMSDDEAARLLFQELAEIKNDVES
jgi:NADPH:quinone reductase-like Zn-dependent oxidoreductase/short-subunit dehydrogenase/acyl carrier protein